MKLQARSKPYFIPEYSLTGDLLSFLTCNLQYRYQNKGSLPPSMPIQLWFGEFIHGVMEEAYLKWEAEKLKFPWDWETEIRPIEEMIDQRLRASGLYPPLKQYNPKHIPEEEIGKYRTEDNPYHRIASARAEASINVWGPDLFPLIDSAELLIKGIRDMPNYNKDHSRSNHYSVNGIIDVLSSFKIENTNQKTLDSYQNKIIQYLKKDKKFNEILKNKVDDEYEIIIDYKGMKRPSIDNDNYRHHEWQILTYSWLRKHQKDAKPIPAGIIFYLNELVPSVEDLKAIQEDIVNNKTDVKISEEDKEAIMRWDGNPKYYPTLSNKFKIDRSIRIIPIEEEKEEVALKEFDSVVNNIESSMIKEKEGSKISEAWTGEADKRTCDACDFKAICQKNKGKIKDISVP